MGTRWPDCEATSRKVAKMARNKINSQVRETVVNRLAILMLRNDDNAEVEIESILWTLSAVGFSTDLVDEIVASAEKLSGVSSS